MKIAHVVSTFPPYEAGTGRVAYFNALELARRGHEVTVFTANYPKEATNYPSELVVKRLPYLFRLGNAPLLPKLLGIRGIDIIHLHWPFIFGAELTWIAASLRNIPYVITHHNDLISEGPRRLLFDPYSIVANHLIAANAKKFCAVSLSHAEDCRLSPIFRKRWEDVVEVPNGVDTTIFHPNYERHTIRNKFGITDDHVVVMFVGALDRAHPFKGVDRLLKAFRRIKSSSARLMIVGGGDMMQHYQELAAENQITDRVIFTGKIMHDDLPSYYAASDMLVLPSVPPESFGMVLIEAGACSRPVIASNIPGVRSVVQDQVDGFLVKPADEDDLVEKISTLIADANLRQQMGLAGHQKVVAKYAWPTVVSKLEEVYQQVVYGRHSS